MKCNAILGLAYLCLISACSFYTNGPKIEKQARAKALLVLDVQNDFFQADGNLPISEAQQARVLTKINRQIEIYQQAKLPIYYVKNEFSPYSVLANVFRNHAAIRGTKGAEFHPDLKVYGNSIYTKDYPDAFSNEALDQSLRDHQIGEIELVGVYASQCLKNTAQGALQRKYQVIVVADAVGDKNDEIVEATLKELEDSGAHILR